MIPILIWELRYSHVFFWFENCEWYDLNDGNSWDIHHDDLNFLKYDLWIVILEKWLNHDLNFLYCGLFIWLKPGDSNYDKMVKYERCLVYIVENCEWYDLNDGNMFELWFQFSESPWMMVYNGWIIIHHKYA